MSAIDNARDAGALTREQKLEAALRGLLDFASRRIHQNIVPPILAEAEAALRAAEPAQPVEVEVIDSYVMDLVRRHGSTMSNSEIVQQFLPKGRLASSTPQEPAQPVAPYTLAQIMEVAQTDVLRARGMFNASVRFVPASTTLQQEPAPDVAELVEQIKNEIEMNYILGSKAEFLLRQAATALSRRVEVGEKALKLANDLVEWVDSHREVDGHGMTQDELLDFPEMIAVRQNTITVCRELLRLDAERGKK